MRSVLLEISCAGYTGARAPNINKAGVITLLVGELDHFAG